MNRKSIYAVAGVVLCAGVSLTAVGASPSSKMTCEDFLALDAVSRPKIVYWFDGFDRFDRKGGPDEVIDFDQNERLVPVLVEECTKNPKHLLAKKVMDVQKKSASH